MRNYIHCMLCGSMFTAQLVFTFGIDRTENEVLLLSSISFTLPLCAGCLFSHCCIASIPLSGDVHVDANGGSGLVPETSQSVHSRSQMLHCFLHHSKLW